MRAGSRVAAALLLAVALAPVTPVQRAQAGDPPGTYTVNSGVDANDYDPSDRVCGNPNIPGTCTLRAALQESDGDGVLSYIHFAQPMTITLNSGLGAIEEHQAHNETFIDASAQWSGTWPGGKPGVTITGGELRIYGGWVRVYGIEFLTRVRIVGGSDNWIGGTDPGRRNVFLGTDGLSVEANGNIPARRNHILGNYFGTEDGATPGALALGSGIWLAPDTGQTTIDGNLIVNASVGIYLYHVADNTISNNVIGLNASQTAAVPNSYGIGLDGASQNTIGPGNVIAGNRTQGIAIMDSSTDNTISGNVIGKHGLGNGTHGVEMGSGQGNTISGCTIVGNGGDGVALTGGTGTVLTDNVIGENAGNGIYYHGGSGDASGNYVGMDKGGADLGNTGYGILVESNGGVLGGMDEASRQWVGYNDLDGVRLNGVGHWVLSHNMVGVTPGGQVALNGHHGIAVYGGGAEVFVGAGSGAGNVVMGTGWSGVVLVNAYGVVVQDNRVGTDGAAARWGNGWYGIAVVNGANNLIARNEVAFSGLNAGEAGVWISGAVSVGNGLAQNSIHDNGGPGISLTDGGNAGLAAPVIAQSSCGGGGGQALSASGTACAGCKVELFADDADEGRQYLGVTTADGSGAWSWSGAAGGPHLTATATDGAANTSAFSAPASACSLVSLPLVRRR